MNLALIFNFVKIHFAWRYAIVRASMAFFSKKLGIDLGTANVLVYVPGKGIVIMDQEAVQREHKI